MLRVLGTIARSPFSSKMQNEQKDLISWAGEIHSGMYSHLVRPSVVPLAWLTRTKNL